MIVIVMGVAGSGKTAAGAALAQSLRWPFFDADDHHPPANLEKMRRGVPLSDADREPWLTALQQLAAAQTNAVLACSALRADFRERLATAARDAVFVYLRVSRAVAEERVRTRGGHFMPEGLVAAQFEALEVPADAIEVDGEAAVDDVVRAIREALRVQLHYNVDPPEMGVAAGTRLGPYEIVAPLGAGGMGEVWRGRDTRLDRTVAIKILPPEFARNAQLRLRFEREARTISQLNHPHICTLYDVGENYLVMELLDGETLADRLARGPLPIDDVIRIGAQIAQALERAHRAGIVHRDLKPGNVMLTKHGAKLLDFGLAKESETSSAIVELTQATEQKPLTAEGTIVGTFQYMAPEQLEGGAVDHRTDIFAFGALLYEMATGRRAFAGKTRASLIAAILATTPQPISSMQPMTPETLDRIVRTCLEKDPDDRFQSAHDIRLELEWLRDVPRTATAIASRKRPILPWALAALFALAAIITSALLWKEFRKDVTPIRTAILPPPGTTFDFRGVGATPTLSPDGRKIVYGVVIGGRRSLWVQELDKSQPRELAGTGGALAPFWSPDSRHLGFFTEGQLMRVPVSGGSPVAICKADAGRGGSWSANGTIIFADRYSPIYRVPASGGSPVAVTELDKSRQEGSHRWPFFLADGDHFVFLASPGGSENQNNQICIASLSKKTRKPLVNASTNAQILGDHLLFVRDGVLNAQKLDLDALTVTGEPVQLDHQPIAGDPLFSRHVVTVSPAGTLLYQTGTSLVRSQLTWADRSGKELGKAGEPDAFSHLALSPDGKTIVVAIRGGATGNLWQIDENGVKTRLTFSKGVVDHMPLFSRDGRKLAYGINRNGVNDIVIRDMTTAAEQPLITGQGDAYPTDWSPDDRLLFYAFNSRKSTTGQDLLYYSFAGAKTHPYLTSSNHETLARLSPDGKWMIYMSEESGNWEVYLAPFPATGAKWQVSNGGGVQARWTKNGREVLYLQPGRLTITSVDVAFTPLPQLGRPTELFTVNPAFTPPSWTVTADGERFLIASRIGDTAQTPPLTLVQHFDREVALAVSRVE